MTATGRQPDSDNCHPRSPYPAGAVGSDRDNGMGAVEQVAPEYVYKMREAREV